jgi:hypothetical protein
MRSKFLTTAAAALIVGVAGAGAFAQSSTSTTTTTITRGGTVAPGQTQVNTQTYVGRPIVDSAGHVVGTITERRDNSYVVSAGQYLGVGTKTYVIPQDKVVIQGSGPSVTITTPLNRDQIVVLPSP